RRYAPPRWHDPCRGCGAPWYQHRRVSEHPALRRRVADGRGGLHELEVNDHIRAQIETVPGERENVSRLRIDADRRPGGPRHEHTDLAPAVPEPELPVVVLDTRVKRRNQRVRRREIVQRVPTDPNRKLRKPASLAGDQR